MSYGEVALQSNFWPILLFKFIIFLFRTEDFVFEIQFTEEP